MTSICFCEKFGKKLFQLLFVAFLLEEVIGSQAILHYQHQPVIAPEAEFCFFQIELHGHGGLSHQGGPVGHYFGDILRYGLGQVLPW